MFVLSPQDSRFDLTELGTQRQSRRTGLVMPPLAASQWLLINRAAQLPR
jgi:hypothetical protein